MNVLVKHLAGSLAYGTNIATSDTDYRGIYLDPPQGIITPWTPKRTEEWEDLTEEDTKLTELYKYMVGYVNGSPNVMESLWVDESHVTQSSRAYEYLRANAGELLSRKLRYSFGGYALGQLKRIKGHNKWINNPMPKTAPIRADYFKLIVNYTDEKVMARDFSIYDYNLDHMLIPYGNNIFGIISSPGNTLFNSDMSIREVNYKRLSDEEKKQIPKFNVKLNEDVFKNDLLKHSQYWTWKKERNETRSELEEQFGHDTKHAMHVVRLLRMCKEVLTDGIIRVKRHDAEELLAIRNGSWKYEELLEWAEDIDNDLDELFKTSPLPPSVDLDKANTILLTAEGIARGHI